MPCGFNLFTKVLIFQVLDLKQTSCNSGQMKDLKYPKLDSSFLYLYKILNASLHRLNYRKSTPQGILLHSAT